MDKYAMDMRRLIDLVATTAPLCEGVIDFNPEHTRELFDLDLKASRGELSSTDITNFQKFLRAHRGDMIQMYHGTSVKHEVVTGKMQGLLPTSARRRLSLQSGSGYVYVTYDPNRALSFAMMGHPREQIFAVYEVRALISDLKPDPDQLRNQRMWNDRCGNIGSTLADSMIYGGGARIKGAVKPPFVSLYGYFDRNYQHVTLP